VGFLNSLFGDKGPRIVELSPMGTRFEVPHGKTILEGALAAGIAFPHDCTVGICGTCKSRLISGRVHALSEFAYTLSQQELAANYILPCQSMARDALIRLDVRLAAATSDAASTFRGRIVGTTPLTHDILSVDLEVEHPLRYLAGQYANISAPGLDRARSYSFATPPCEGGVLRTALCVRKVPGGQFTDALFAGLLTAVELEVHGPHGNFFLRDGQGPIVCVAGGSGLAPIISLLEEAARRRVTRPAVLLFGARTEQDLYFRERIAAVGADWAAPFTFLPVLSHEPAGSAWTGARGLVTEYLADSVSRDQWSHVQGYLCGPPGMIDVGIAGMTDLGLTLDAIFYDKFTDASHAARMS
jgi:p-cymene methyl-monooxygenase electron transfer component